MNLQKLFEAQAELDRHIYEQHPVEEGENRLQKKMLAMLVEIGECANEFREFKYWSNDQTPRTEVLVFAHLTDGRHVQRVENFVIKELVDIVHFALSIGVDLHLTKIEPEPVMFANKIEQFNELFAQASYLYLVTKRNGSDIELRDEYVMMWSIIFGLVGHLGFTWEQVEDAYFAKNEENHKRQENGY